MTDPAYVITVQYQRVGEHPCLEVFRTTVLTPEGERPEFWGHVSLLQAYLEGLETCLVVEGYIADLSWRFPHSWERHTGVRWTIDSKGVLAKQENLDVDGNVILDP